MSKAESNERSAETSANSESSDSLKRLADEMLVGIAEIQEMQKRLGQIGRK